MQIDRKWLIYSTLTTISVCYAYLLFRIPIEILNITDFMLKFCLGNALFCTAGFLTGSFFEERKGPILRKVAGIVVILSIGLFLFTTSVNLSGMSRNLYITFFVLLFSACFAVFFVVDSKAGLVSSLASMLRSNKTSAVVGFVAGLATLAVAIKLLKLIKPFLAESSIFITALPYLRRSTVFVIFFFVIGLFLYAMDKRTALHGRMTAWLSSVSNRRFVVLLAVLAVVSLPGILRQVITYWDMSGFHDSYAYDFWAMEIARGTHPEGSSYYMPFYIYGLAFIYYVFGHFFYVQQIVNILLYVAMTVLLGLSAWNVFRNIWAVLLLGLWGALNPYFYQFITHTQIESWYVPLSVLAVYMWSLYWRNPTTKHILLLGISIALCINTRTQEAFYFALLFLTPFFIKGIHNKERVIHTVAAGLVVGVSLIPWSLRNYIVEGRFSPSSEQSIIQLAIINDKRIGFYGVRYYDRGAGYWNIHREYYQKYPDKEERYRAMSEFARKRLLSDPEWRLKAVYWRSLAFFGILPPGVMASDGPRPTNWRTEGPAYIQGRLLFFMLLGLPLLGFLARPGRVSLFLVLSILASASVVYFAYGNEARACFPLMPREMLLALCVLFEPFPDSLPDAFNKEKLLPEKLVKCTMTGIVFLPVFLIFSFYTIGKRNLDAPFREKGISIDRGLKLDADLPLLNDYYRKNAADSRPKFHSGQKVLYEATITNYQYPPKRFKRTDLPRFSYAIPGETYYWTHPLEGGTASVSFLGAAVSSELRENDEVQIEAEVLLPPDQNERGIFWLKAEKVQLLKK